MSDLQDFVGSVTSSVTSFPLMIIQTASTSFLPLLAIAFGSYFIHAHRMAKKQDPSLKDEQSIHLVSGAILVAFGVAAVGGQLGLLKALRRRA